MNRNKMSLMEDMRSEECVELVGRRGQRKPGGGLCWDHRQSPDQAPPGGDGASNHILISSIILLLRISSCFPISYLCVQLIRPFIPTYREDVCHVPDLVAQT